MLIAPDTTALASSQPAAAVAGANGDISRAPAAQRALRQLNPTTNPTTSAPSPTSPASWITWRPPLILQLIAASLIAHIAMNGARITTTLYALSLQASQFAVGTLVAVFGLFPVLCAVPMGRLIDRVGITRPMLCGCLAMCIGCLLPPLTSGLPWLYLSSILVGTGFVTIQIASQHTVGVMSTGHNRSTNFSWLALGYSVSSFCGPVIAGLVIDHARHAVSYLVFGAFALSSLLMIAASGLHQIKLPQASTDRTGKHGGMRELLQDPDLRRIYAMAILLGSAWDLFTFVTPIHGSQLGFSASTIGLILGCFSIATFVVRLAMPSIARRYTEWQVLAGALVLAVLCYLLLPFMHRPLPMMLVAAALGLALGSSQPNVLALLHQTAPTGRAGEAVGIRATISNATGVVLPLAFGAAGATLGLFAVFWGMGTLIGSGVPLIWRKACASTVKS